MRAYSKYGLDEDAKIQAAYIEAAEVHMKLSVLYQSYSVLNSESTSRRREYS